MKVSNLSSYIIRLYEAGRGNGRITLFLLGGPGIGKSHSVLQAAKEIAAKMKKEFVIYNDDIAPTILANPERYFVYTDFRLTECEPTDLIGIPEKITSVGATRFSPMLWARVMSKTAGILMLDELTNVPRDDVLSEAYKLTFDRSAGFVKFHDDVMIIGCGNRPEDSSIARMLPAPLVNRLLIINVDTPTVDEWKEFMDSTYGEEWDRRTYFFLKRFETDGYLYMPPKSTEVLEAYPTPRSWTSTARLLYKGFDDLDTLIGLVGSEVGYKLHAFLSINVSLETILDKPQMYTEYPLDTKYMIISMLVTHVTKHIKDAEAMDKVLRLFNVIATDTRELALLLIRSIETKWRPEFIRQILAKYPQYNAILEDIIKKKNLL